MGSRAYSIGASDVWIDCRERFSEPARSPYRVSENFMLNPKSWLVAGNENPPLHVAVRRGRCDCAGAQHFVCGVSEDIGCADGNHAAAVVGPL